MPDKRIGIPMVKISVEDATGNQISFMQLPLVASPPWAITMYLHEAACSYEERMDMKAWAAHGVDIRV